MESTVYSAYGSISEIIRIVDEQHIDIRTEEETEIYNNFLQKLFDAEHELFNIGVRNGTIV